MINLGFYSGKSMSGVRLWVSPADKVMEGVIALLVIVTWALAGVFYFRVSLASWEFFLMPAVATLLAALMGWAARAPIGYYNFPVRLTERNCVYQYRLASRLTRIAGIEGILISLSFFLSGLDPMSDQARNVFHVIGVSAGGALLASFIVYYVIAFRYK